MAAVLEGIIPSIIIKATTSRTLRYGCSEVPSRTFFLKTKLSFMKETFHCFETKLDLMNRENFFYETKISFENKFLFEIDKTFFLKAKLYFKKQNVRFEIKTFFLYPASRDLSYRSS